MTNHPHFSFLRAATAGFLMVGIAVILGAHGNNYLAQLSGGGITLLASDLQTTGSVTTTVNDLHAAAVAEDSMMMQLQWQLMVGMLLVLGGFLCHALFVMKHRKAPLGGGTASQSWAVMK